MNPIQITANGQPIDFLGPLPEKIEILSIMIHPLAGMLQVPEVRTKQWLNDLITRTTAKNIMYNGTYMEVADLKKFDL